MNPSIGECSVCKRERVNGPPRTFDDSGKEYCSLRCYQSTLPLPPKASSVEPPKAAIALYAKGVEWCSQKEIPVRYLRVVYRRGKANQRYQWDGEKWEQVTHTRFMPGLSLLFPSKDEATEHGLDGVQPFKGSELRAVEIVLKKTKSKKRRKPIEVVEVPELSQDSAVWYARSAGVKAGSAVIWSEDGTVRPAGSRETKGRVWPAK